ncbi:alpha/beta hydrolase [Pseudohalocynthiibacter sp. F2068]|jgi:3-oxoadipate enol-lactonase|uniref:alpha/beta fold hydrolase n=1 Tax=Pseudohalocynthiibacter sp. F2068 TaxID=2926418 RepID=UPI001FF4AF17|nr:alpha/beta hydrolase [Pseudohalocynthiibacter sp. F2068]MCK0103800.1 alpha/beta hydrolase [Pseudohalocynthiibacter sp. F2068]
MGNSTAPTLAHHTVGNGPEKVLMLHSWIDNSHSMDNITPYLDTDAYTFVFADLRGYGGSIDIKGEYTSTEAATDAFNLADHLGWDRFHLMGHSMSGMISQRAALIDWTSGKKRLKSVVAITPVTANGYPADEDTKGFLQSSIHNAEVASQLAAGLTGGRLSMKYCTAVAEANIASSSADAMLGYYNMWVGEDFSEEAKAASIQTPLLVIAGKQDLPGFQTDYYKETFGAWYPKVEIKTIDEAGHMPMYETPLILGAMVEGFLNEQTAAA